MIHTAHRGFVPASEPRHARLFELIRQTHQSFEEGDPSESASVEGIAAVQMAALRRKACASLYRD